MKKQWVVLVGAALTLGAAVASIPGFALTGNGAPSGPHYGLNTIGVTNAKNAPLTGSDRHTIFVPLNTPANDPVPGTDIFLTQGPFTVCDGNAFDAAYDCNGIQIAKQGAVFQLPCNTNIATATATTLVPCSTGDTATYSLWTTATLTPAGSGTLSTPPTDPPPHTVLSSLTPNL